MILENQLPLNSIIYIYGSGSAGLALYAWLSKCRKDVTILGFIDSYKSGKILGKKLYAFKQFSNTVKTQSYDVIAIASTYQKEIISDLKQSKIEKFVVAHAPSYLLKEILPGSWQAFFLGKIVSTLAFMFKKKYHLFFGEHGGKFVGNNKYYFLRVQNELKGRIFWVVEDQNIYDFLKSRDIPVLLFSKFSTRWILFRSQFFYFDNMTWQRKFPWLRFLRARIIHMSHGVGLKFTEKMMIPDEFLSMLTEQEEKRLNARIFSNDVLVSTSEFYAREVSSPAYNTPMDNIICSGYPKNDLFYEPILGYEIYTDTSTLNGLIECKKKGKKIIVYAPTFRDMNADFDVTSIINFQYFADFLRKNDLLLVIKGHTSVFPDTIQSGMENDCIFIYQNDRDGYPLLKLADLLITDYSSIYMDFLHVMKPVLFFPYDIDDYLKQHRMMQFDYFEMTPGPKAYNQEELIVWIKTFLLMDQDDFQLKRREIFHLAFSYKDGNSWQRIHQTVKKLSN